MCSSSSAGSSLETFRSGEIALVHRVPHVPVSPVVDASRRVSSVFSYVCGPACVDVNTPRLSSVGAAIGVETARLRSANQQHVPRVASPQRAALVNTCTRLHVHSSRLISDSIGRAKKSARFHLLIKT